MRRKQRDTVADARVWSKTILHAVDGTPTLGEVMDACERPYITEIETLHDAWEAWLETPDQFISEDMLQSFSRLLELAGLDDKDNGQDVSA